MRATTDYGGPITALVARDTIVGTQFHPEVDPPHLEGFLADTTDEYLNEYGTLRDDLVKLTNVNHERARAQCNEFVDWFLTITDR